MRDILDDRWAPPARRIFWNAQASRTATTGYRSGASWRNPNIAACLREDRVSHTSNSTVSDILARLQPVFRDVLENPALQVTREASAMTIDGWDSFAHVILISSVEREFGVRFALGELEELKCVGDMVDLIAKKLAK
jgi:acyl carrier protein